MFKCYRKGCRGSLHTSRISHLLLYPSLWLLVPGLSSQFLPLFPIQPAFNVSGGHQDLGEMATRFCKLWEPLGQYDNKINSTNCEFQLTWNIQLGKKSKSVLG